MRSTLHLKFIIVYIIFAFLSVFTVATLTDTLTSGPLVSVTASNTYQEANMMATDYLPDYFSEEVSLNEVRLQLSGMETHLDAALWLVDREGRLLASAQSEGLPPAPSQIQDFNPAEAGNSQYLTGDYHGYFQEDVITVIAPVIHGYSPAGYLLVHKSLDYVNEVQGILRIYFGRNK